MKYDVKIIKIENVTPDVKRFVVEKPEGYKFTPGQATSLSINDGTWKYEERPFTFTSLNEDEFLEFTIKKYPEHGGVTKKLHELKAGDELIMGDPWGAIKYKGPGIFIAGGAGVTPFIAIFRDLKSRGEVDGNKLIFSNKTSGDVILEDELREILGDNAIFTLTIEENSDYENGRIDEKFLEEHVDNFDGNFYVCGPRGFVKDILAILRKLGAVAESLVFEK